MSTEQCAHSDQVCDLVDRFQQWKGYECPYCEIERLRADIESLKRYTGVYSAGWQSAIARPTDTRRD